MLDAAKKPARRLGSLLAPLSAEYDVVFLDCPPGISLLSESVLQAADTLLVPLIPTTLSVRTLDQLTEFIAGLNGHRPAILAFFSMIDRRKRLHKEISVQLPEQRTDVAATAIPAHVDDRADVGAARPGDRVRAAQRGRAPLRGALDGGPGARRAARPEARRRLVTRGDQRDGPAAAPVAPLAPAVPAAQRSGSSSMP